ncbi:ImuA family protein [Sneathiella glossodoripedis]|uniref:ImuA family protein n=1 Tax=Sneathiella glossodoripedis TaxID=418853 RepID=UPI00047099A7|nr:hypothetical protein [Sneathiella glossodoripedis]
MSGTKEQVLARLKQQIHDLGHHVALPEGDTSDWQRPNSLTLRQGFFGIPQMDKCLPDGQLTDGAVHEFVPASHSDFPAALGYALCCLQRLQRRNVKERPVLWCSSTHRGDYPGNLHPHGLMCLGLNPANFLHIRVSSEKEFLWVLEESLASEACPLVIGAYIGAEKNYDFTVSRRLALRASRVGSTLLIIRNYRAVEGEERSSVTAALTRWSVQGAPSAPEFFKNAHIPAMGKPRWQVKLTRCRGGRTGQWQLEWQHETHSFNLVSSLVNRAAVHKPTRSPFAATANVTIRDQAGASRKIRRG